MLCLDQATRHGIAHSAEADESDVHEVSSSSSLRGAQATKQSIYSCRGEDESLRFARDDGVAAVSALRRLVDLGKELARDAKTVDRRRHAAIDRGCRKSPWPSSPA